MRKFETMDGNQAAAYASYAFTEVAAIFPITPSSPMAEAVDEWSSQGVKNLFGQRVKVAELQSEAGAAGAMHGSLAAGALTTTYTASQGLLLMIPNLYKMAGELLPGVLHVSARAIAAHALSIFGDHQDVMACRQTGAALLASSNVQEAHDMAIITHLSSIASRIPFIHFFDGFRTSHEVQKIEVLDYDDFTQMVNFQAIEAFRKRALNPQHPVARGTAQNPDIYFQGREAANPFYDAIPDIVEGYMQDFKKLTGREYHPFDYYGPPDAENIIIAMGSVCDTVEEVIDEVNKNGMKTGIIRVHLYRPFSPKHFFNVFPNTAKRICVLDRTKEPGALGEPLYLDIVKLFYNNSNKPLIIGGRYGLGSKDTRPSQILSVLHNLLSDTPKDNFTIGINDDITHTSLPDYEPLEIDQEGTINCKIWGLGSDGTVGANKTAIKIIGDHTDLYVQGYFSYDSKKSGGTTISHLRFGKYPIKSPYLVYRADYIACHNSSFVFHYDLLTGLKENGIFVLNCPWKETELEEKLPAAIKKEIAQKKARFYIVDAQKIASEVGLGNRINMVMQSVFFKLSEVLPLEDAISYLKSALEKTYGKKGQKVIDMNQAAIDRGILSPVQVNIPDSWINAPEEPPIIANEPPFVLNIQRKMARHEGDLLPVSAFKGMEDGSFPLGTTAYEKRGIAVTLPQWQMEKCIQCGRCSYVCPHATIRLFHLDENERQKAPQDFVTKKAAGKGLEGFYLRVQVSPMDCTGCGNCADVCPAEEKALVMKPAEQEIKRELEHWEFAMSITDKEDILDRNTLKGSQLIRPLLEFNGACPGCGETPYIRLLTQLFGERMMIANATGCSSIWAASAPSIAYTTNVTGKGPAWANSLFEDNAEYGYGMFLGAKQIRERLADLINQALLLSYDETLKTSFKKWIENMNDGKLSKEVSLEIVTQIENMNLPEDTLLQEILSKKDFLNKKSFWMLGGDGWAYDIGYGGLDHVIASGEDINLFVMDTEVYSNTGGQSSKATPTAAVAKFAASGKKTRKKDLGLMATCYGYVYVAQIAMGADMNQTIKAITEAERYPGPSLIIAYSPCVNHGIKAGMGSCMKEQFKAVASGYWHLFRYNPLLREEGKNPFILDSKEPSSNFMEFLDGEVRYSSLKKVFPEHAEDLYRQAEENAAQRFAAYKLLSDENG